MEAHAKDSVLATKGSGTVEAPALDIPHMKSQSRPMSCWHAVVPQHQQEHTREERSASAMCQQGAGRASAGCRQGVGRASREVARTCGMSLFHIMRRLSLYSGLSLSMSAHARRVITSA